MRTSRGVRAAALALAAACLGACSRKPARSVFPGAPVVLISIDTLRADRLPLYGYTKIATPSLDLFAKDAWLFENAYSPCPMTLPSHTTMLTGLLPPEHGVRNNIGFAFDGAAHASLPRLLEQHGYATGAAVSSYVLRSEAGLGPLFDFYEDSFGTVPGIQAVHYRRPGDETAAFAEAWIGEHVRKPFFFLFHIYEPHLPYAPPEPFRSRYGVTYDAEVATADAIVGAFLDDLKKLGVYDRAIVIVTADHGEGLGEHGEEQHSIFLYREAIKVPLLVKLPGGSGGGRRATSPVQLSDIFPTVTEALGLPTPKEVSGKSLFEVSAPGAAARPIYGETLFPRLQLGWSDLRSVLDDRYQYIHGPRPELYDMVRDPHELNDLAKSDPDTVVRLARELQRFPKGNEKPESVDEETRRRLTSLGYLGTLRDGGRSADLPNPADNLPALRRMEEAWRLGAEGRVAEAIDVLRASVRENPGMFDAWVKLAELLSEAGRDDEAAAAYRQALARMPAFLPDISLELASVELRRQNLDEAERLARLAATAVPSRAHELLASVALARGNFAAAEAEAAAASSSRNPQPSAILALARVKLREGKAAEALEAVERAQAVAGDKHLGSVYDLEFLRGDALARLNRMDEAEAAFRAEIRAFPAHSEPYANLAVIRFMKGDRSEPDRLLAEMVRANPSPRSYLVAARTLEALGEKQKAAAFRSRSDAPRR
ncbi:MAG TPA: sulfatase-like hydrolase/transferase [Thermoanaerobaculia bacterium]|nr:sulfatase-like hydrolase/transferase [Thermoanaerobaculia bacterium]